METTTLPRLLLRNAAERGGAPAMRHKRLGIWRTWSWGEQAAEVGRLAFGLASRGLGPGARLGVLAGNRPETYWSIAAAQALRAVPVPLPADLGPDEILARLRGVPVDVAIAEGQEQLDHLLAVRDALPHLRAIVYVDGRGLRGYGSDEHLASMDSVLADGERLRRTSPDLVDTRIAGAAPDDVAVVLHSSACGGAARPVTVSHAELIASAASAARLFSLSGDERVIALLATSSFIDHQTSYVQSHLLGYCVHCPEARDTILADLREVAPTYMAMSPRVVEALLRRIDARMCGASKWRRRLLSVACASGSRLSRALVLAPLVDGLGLSRLRVAVAVGRRAHRDVVGRWRSLGLPLVAALGCTEAAGFPAILTDDGELGDAAPGFEVGFIEGELAYRRNVPGVASQRWEPTGDVAVRNAHGKTVICRRDELFAVREREIAPSVVEARLTAVRDVRDALVIPDGTGGVAALIVPDPELLAAWAAERAIPYSTPGDLASNGHLLRHFARIVSGLNLELEREGMSGWTVGAFTLCFAPFEANDFGPSGQPRRPSIEARHRDVLARLRQRGASMPEGWVDPGAFEATAACPTAGAPAQESAA